MSERGSTPTMKDVAKAAGVGVMTVSRVINGVPVVSPALVDRVNTAIRELGYQRNHFASTLRRRGAATNTIGLIVDDVANPFYGALAGAIEDFALDKGYTVLFGSSKESPQRERELLAAFGARRVDGLVLVPTSGGRAHLAEVVRDGPPTVLVDRPADGLPVDSVVIDNQRGARDAVAHLIRGGHRRIAFLGDRLSIWTAQQRLAGYRAALDEAGIAHHPALVLDSLRTVWTAEAACRTLLAGSPSPTALFTANDVITIGALRALRDHPVPTALAGFDDFPLSEQLDPAVTVVAHDPVALGSTAAEVLFDRTEGRDSPPREVVLPTRLIVRGSSEVRPDEAAV
jgi:LacI family transcriptional regulator